MYNVLTVPVEHTEAAKERGLCIGRENVHWKLYLLEKSNLIVRNKSTGNQALLRLLVAEKSVF